MQRITTFLLPLLTIAATCFSYSFHRKVREGIYPELPASLQALETFNDLGGFTQDSTLPSLFRYEGTSTSPETYLRFAIPNFNPVGYTLTICLRGRPALLKSSYQRFAMGRTNEKNIHNDTATYVIRMDSPEPFMWTNGNCYVGVGFPAASLHDGEVVELVDFKFSYNLDP